MTCDPCAVATRPHDHLAGGRLRAFARDKSWDVVVRDDGSICGRDVQLVAATVPPQNVLAFLLSERDLTEKKIHNERRRK